MKRRFKISMMQKLATRISNVVLPERAYGVFEDLYKLDRLLYGNDHGHATPRKQMAGAGQTYSANIPSLPSEIEIDNVHQRATFQTRDQIIQRQVGLSPLSVQALPARDGVGSARAVPSLSPAMGDHDHAGEGFVDDNGRYHGTAFDGNPVNPGGMGAIERLGPTGTSASLDRLNPSLAQTIGSGMLSQAQLQAASYQNVYSLIKMGAGTEEDHRTAAFLLQRMALEGYVRGVDVLRQLKDSGGLHYSVGSPRCGYSCGGWDGSGPFVDMNSGGYGSDVALLNIFYQETGHALGQLVHTRGLMAGSYQYSDLTGQTVANYSQWLDMYFQDVGKVRFTPTRGDVNAADFIKQHPDWYPSLSGVAIPPGGGTGPGPGGTTSITNIHNPATIGGAAAGGTIPGSGMEAPSQGAESEKTPVAGSLPNIDAVRSFAAGLQDQAGRQAPSVQALAGALLRYKSG